MTIHLGPGNVDAALVARGHDIPIRVLQLDDVTAAAAPPFSQLFGKMAIEGCMFHVEAWQVARDDNGIQRAVDPEFNEDLDALATLVDAEGPLQTLNLDGRDYVLHIYPFAR